MHNIKLGNYGIIQSCRKVLWVLWIILSRLFYLLVMSNITICCYHKCRVHIKWLAPSSTLRWASILGWTCVDHVEEVKQTRLLARFLTNGAKSNCNELKGFLSSCLDLLFWLTCKASRLVLEVNTLMSKWAIIKSAKEIIRTKLQIIFNYLLVMTLEGYL